MRSLNKYDERYCRRSSLRTCDRFSSAALTHVTDWLTSRFQVSAASNTMFQWMAMSSSWKYAHNVSFGLGRQVGRYLVFCFSIAHFSLPLRFPAVLHWHPCSLAPKTEESTQQKNYSTCSVGRVWRRHHGRAKLAQEIRAEDHLAAPASAGLLTANRGYYDSLARAATHLRKHVFTCKHKKSSRYFQSGRLLHLCFLAVTNQYSSADLADLWKRT